MSTTCAVGIDTNSYGFHVVASEPVLMYDLEEMQRGWTPDRNGWFQVPSHESPRDRRRQVYPAICEFFRSLPVGSVVAVEEPLILMKNAETTRTLVMMGGIIEAALWESEPDLQFVWVPVSTWRRVVLDPPKGQAPRNKDGWKALARRYVLDHTSMFPYSVAELHEMEREPDLYDAACIMVYAKRALAIV